MYSLLSSTFPGAEMCTTEYLVQSQSCLKALSPRTTHRMLTNFWCKELNTLMSYSLSDDVDHTNPEILAEGGQCNVGLGFSNSCATSSTVAGTWKPGLKECYYSAYLMQLCLVLLCVVTLLGSKRGHWLIKTCSKWRFCLAAGESA